MTEEKKILPDYDTLKHGAGFMKWLKDSGYKSKSYQTECLWVQRNGLVKLDQEYERDRCATITARLANAGEFRRFVGSRKEDADPKTNLSSYRSAVKKYVEFMDHLRYGDSRYDIGDAKSARRRRGRTAKSSPVKVSYLEGFGPNGKIEPETAEQEGQPHDIAEIASLWKDYMRVTNRITAALGRSANIVGEFAERLAAEYYGGKLLTASHKSADIQLDDGRLVQVKSRVPRQTLTTSLSPIRSWDFGLLVVILFNPDGSVLKALEMKADAAREHARRDSHQNSDLIVTTDEFLNDPLARDITGELAALMSDDGEGLL